MSFRKFLEINESESQLFKSLIKTLNKNNIEYKEIEKSIGQPTLIVNNFKIASGSVFHDQYTVFTKAGKEIESFKDLNKLLSFIKKQ